MTDSVKQFVTAAEEQPDDVSLDLDHSFKLGDTVWEARLPSKGEIELWIIATGNGNQAGYDETIRFLKAVLHDSSWDDENGRLLEDAPEDFDPDEQMRELYKMLRNPRAKISLEDFIPAVQWLVEERAKFPTTSSSGSTSGRRASGQSSTRSGSRKPSTRSRSTPAASAD